MQVAAVDNQYAAAKRGRRRGFSSATSDSSNSYGSSGSITISGRQFDRVLERRHGISARPRRQRLCIAEHPQHIMRIGVGVEGHPRLFPDRDQKTRSRSFAPYARAAASIPLTLSVISLASAASLRFPTEHPAQAQDRFDPRPGTVRGYVVNTGIPAARIRSTSSRRFLFSVCNHQLRARASRLRRCRDSWCPPTFGIDATAATARRRTW